MSNRLLLLVLVVLGGLGLASVFTVNETEYAIRFQLGKIVRMDYMPGLHFKLPFVNNVRKFDRRILTLDTASERMLTSEQKFVNVDSFVKWRISDVSQFYISTQGNERAALNRLEQIIRDGMRNQIASRTLVEVVSEERVNIMVAIAEAANRATAEFGIDVVDVRIKSIELPDDVRESVFRRMATDRQKEANLLRFEGREESERIRANADRQVQVILANAERDGQRTRGEGDARATAIYAEAYGADEEFYAFYRSLQAYGNAFRGREDVLVLDPGSDFFEYFDQYRSGSD
ncbi:MAG: protease modulator HflC [Xanthomonadales bacterium]|nr:protease modulator HflC [Xanthomonadales bacterium]NIN60785.1 protease modulator HflC [Xanthomonadales bacterium]NIN76147.1 protease modulator HflC [Xanthomonadales bacterium]NIO15368.1 protease modulator HflC [Xanthomonadales bacterium]NIP13178.1 protease modulator HflC [Xanthomonadales bacterium]